MEPTIQSELRRLQDLTQAAVDDELPGAPQWIADASLDALDKVRLLRALAGIDPHLVPTGQALRAHLGESWVDLHEEIFLLVERSAGWSTG